MINCQQGSVKLGIHGATVTAIISATVAALGVNNPLKCYGCTNSFGTTHTTNVNRQSISAHHDEIETHIQDKSGEVKKCDEDTIAPYLTLPTGWMAA